MDHSGERKHVEQLIRSNIGYFDSTFVNAAYQRLGLQPISDPYDLRLLTEISDALKAKRAFSAIRLGNREMNILAYGADTATPNLDFLAGAKSIKTQSNSFEVDHQGMSELCEMMQDAVHSADMVGVLGLWRPWRDADFSEDDAVDFFRSNLQQGYGHFRGMHTMLEWAKRGRLADKTLASAHLYFGVLAGLKDLIPLSKSVLCITDKTQVVEALQGLYPDKEVAHVLVGDKRKKQPGTLTRPVFLEEVESELPDDMMGCLCLIGAGVWAEYYCTLVKARGGVAIDLGSGFDLLAGESSRPIHQSLSDEDRENLSLVKPVDA